MKDSFSKNVLQYWLVLFNVVVGEYSLRLDFITLRWMIPHFSMEYLSLLCHWKHFRNIWTTRRTTGVVRRSNLWQWSCKVLPLCCRFQVQGLVEWFDLDNLGWVRVNIVILHKWQQISANLTTNVPYLCENITSWPKVRTCVIFLYEKPFWVHVGNKSSRLCEIPPWAKVGSHFEN